MIDKHYKVALVATEALPCYRSGGGMTAGTTAKTIGAADANNLLSLKGAVTGHRGFQAADVAGRFGASPSGFTDGLGRAPGTFVSLFDAAGIRRDFNCLNAPTGIESAQVERLKGDCFPGGNNAVAENSAIWASRCTTRLVVLKTHSILT